MVDGLTGQRVDADFSHPNVHILHVAVEAQELPTIRWVLHDLDTQTDKLPERVTQRQLAAHPLSIIASQQARTVTAMSPCLPAQFPAQCWHGRALWGSPLPLYLSHVNDAHCQGLVAQDGAVLVSLPPLQHDL